MQEQLIRGVMSRKGSGYGSVYGDGDGYGYGLVYGYGCGYGYGSGYGYGYGEGYGSGYGEEDIVPCKSN